MRDASFPALWTFQTVAHLALYRKYRSQLFSDLVGQQHVVRTLQSALSQGKIAHAYLFTGPRGTGKTSTARLLAKALNCEKGPAAEPCNQCESCVAITKGASLDVTEMDAASESGVDGVRESIVEAVEYVPASSRYRVFIIDEVHDLSAKAFDALLKTIEEPPPHVVLILATTEFGKVPETIRSRCQRYEFHRATVAEVAACLKRVIESEGATVEPAAMDAIARMADGGFRDALSLLEQVLLTSDGPVTAEHVYHQLGLIPATSADELLVAMAESDVPKVIALVEEFYRLGRDPRTLIESLLHRLADLTRAAYGLRVGEGPDAALESALVATAARLGKHNVLMFRSGLAEANRYVRDVSLPRVWLEAELLRLAQHASPDPPRPTAFKAPKPREVAAVVPGLPTDSAGVPSAAPPTTNATPEAATAAEGESALHSDPVAFEGSLESAQAVWRQLVARLAEKHTRAGMKLARTAVVSVNDSEWVVAFERRLDCDFIQAHPKAREAIRTALNEHPGTSAVRLEYVCERSQPTPTPVNEAVELPSEGERLAELAREVFGEA